MENFPVMDYSGERWQFESVVLSIARSFGIAVGIHSSDEEYIYIMGGYDCTAHNIVEIFNPVTGQIQTGPSMLNARYSFVGTVVQRSVNTYPLMVFGGIGTSYIDATEASSDICVGTLFPTHSPSLPLSTLEPSQEPSVPIPINNTSVMPTLTPSRAPSTPSIPNHNSTLSVMTSLHPTSNPFMNLSVPLSDSMLDASSSSDEGLTTQTMIIILAIFLVLFLCVAGITLGVILYCCLHKMEKRIRSSSRSRIASTTVEGRPIVSRDITPGFTAYEHAQIGLTPAGKMTEGKSYEEKEELISRDGQDDRDDISDLFAMPVSGATNTTPGKSGAAVSSMTQEEVLTWLKEEVGLSEYCEVFKEQGIRGMDLLEFDHETLSHDLGIRIRGHRGQILRAIKQLCL